MKENKKSNHSPTFCLKTRVWNFSAMFLLISLSSCQQKTFDSKEDLVAHITDPENGYIQKKNISGVDYSITYRPTDMLVRQETNENTTSKDIDSLRNKYKKYLYFNLSLAKNDKEILSNIRNSRSDFGAMVNQLAFGMTQKVHLFSQTKDTVKLLDYIYPREYGMGGATNMMFVFPREERLLENEFFLFTIEDIGLKTGEVGFKIPTELVKNEAKLDFKI